MHVLAWAVQLIHIRWNKEKYQPPKANEIVSFGFVEAFGKSKYSEKYLRGAKNDLNQFIILEKLYNIQKLFSKHFTSFPYTFRVYSARSTDLYEIFHQFAQFPCASNASNYKC